MVDRRNSSPLRSPAGNDGKIASKRPSGRDDYLVGKGRPPVPTRWKPGQSGNLTGRPKGRKNITIEINEVLDSKITIKEGGKFRNVTTLEAIARAMTAGALRGDHKLLSLILDADNENSSKPPKKKSEPTKEEALNAYMEVLKKASGGC
jgi:hypothetical protein